MTIDVQVLLATGGYELPFWSYGHLYMNCVSLLQDPSHVFCLILLENMY
jgi:hypothetical protein